MVYNVLKKIDLMYLLCYFKIGGSVMSDEEIHQACEYIKTHKPQATVFSTIKHDD